MDATEEKKDNAVEDAKKEESTEGKKPASSEELQKQLDELTRHAKNKEEEAVRVQKKFEKLQADEDKRKKEELSELDRLKLEKQEAETKAEAAERTLQTERAKSSIYAEANKAQFGDKKVKFVDAEVVYQLLTEEEKAGDIITALQAKAKKYPFLLDQPASNGDGVGTGKKAKQTINSERKQDYKIPRL